jgi:chemotaxis protein CheY-P-specific phosphatase CheC
MPIPILICDDSSLARKQITRSLPENWDVEITYARDGKEGLAAIREGKADVLFLDLTMPVLDGFGVLETIREEDLPTLPIVVSGDIQIESEQRVKALGAVAFLKKPVDSQRLRDTLDEFGLLQLTSVGGIKFEENVSFSDWCQEIANVSKGRAADLLSQAVHTSVELSIPKVEKVEFAELAMILGHGDEENGFVATQGFTGAGIAGEVLLMFYETRPEDIVALMEPDENPNKVNKIEALMDTSNILVGAFLNALSDLLDLPFSLGQPVLTNIGTLDRIWHSDTAAGKGKVLSISFHYTIAGSIKCEQMVLFTERSIEALNRRAAASLG